MKNVRENQLKKCIFMELDEFKNLVNRVTDGLKQVEYELDGIYYEDTEKAEETDIYWNKYMNETLSEYFDVEVTSVHTDDCDVIGVWICYR